MISWLTMVALERFVKASVASLKLNTASVMAPFCILHLSSTAIEAGFFFSKLKEKIAVVPSLVDFGLAVPCFTWLVIYSCGLQELVCKLCPRFGGGIMG